MNLGVQRLCHISLAEDHILGSDSNEINFLLKKTVLLTNKNCGTEQYIVHNRSAACYAEIICRLQAGENLSSLS